jgi:hypothetical protein
LEAKCDEILLFFLEKKEKVSQSTRTSDEFWCYNKIAFGLAIGKNVHLIRHCENLRSFPTLKKITLLSWSDQRQPSSDDAVSYRSPSYTP